MAFAVQEATFIALMFFFWILLVHSIAQTDQLLNLNPIAFYLPKVVVCLMIWVYLLLVGLLTHENTRKISVPLRILGYSVCCFYGVYFGIISYSVLQLVNNMKKAYKILVQVTLVVITLSLVFLFAGGQMSQYDMPLLYFAQYSLLNTYLLLVAYLYSPTTVVNKGSAA